MHLYVSQPWAVKTSAFPSGEKILMKTETHRVDQYPFHASTTPPLALDNTSVLSTCSECIMGTKVTLVIYKPMMHTVVRDISC